MVWEFSYMTLRRWIDNFVDQKQMAGVRVNVAEKESETNTYFSAHSFLYTLPLNLITTLRGQYYYS